MKGTLRMRFANTDLPTWSKLSSALMTAGLMLASSQAFSQQGDAAANYPNRNVRVIVAAPAGGGVDIVARIVAERLQKKLGRPFVVENRAGAGGNLGAGIVAQAEPDGYTLLAAGPAPFTTNLVLYKDVNYDAAAFKPLVIMTSMPNVLAVRSNLPVNSVTELIDYAKANPGKLNFGSPGVGTYAHLTGELFARVTGTQLTHVPYRGSAQAVNDLIAGTIDVLFFQIDAVLQHYQAKTIKILAVTTQQRVSALPDVPTLEEAGVPNVRMETWNLLAAPARTPPAVVAKLNQMINEVLASPETVAQFQMRNMQPVGGTSEDVTKLLKEESDRWGGVLRAADIRAP
jgi:tripartite-type tricarboxylate transporter receptor subunit TctC